MSRVHGDRKDQNLLDYLLFLFQRYRPHVDGVDVLPNAVVKQDHVGTWRQQTSAHYNSVTASGCTLQQGEAKRPCGSQPDIRRLAFCTAGVPGQSGFNADLLSDLVDKPD